MKYLVNRKTKEHRIAGDDWADSTTYKVVEADAEGWIPSDGKRCPLPDGARHEVKYRCGNTEEDGSPETWNWGYELDDPEYDIIAYRPILDKPEAIKAIPAPEYDPRSVSFNVLKRLEAAHEAAQRIPDLESELDAVLRTMGCYLGKLSPFVDGADTDVATMPDMTDWRNWRAGDVVEVTRVDDGDEVEIGDVLTLRETSRVPFCMKSNQDVVCLSQDQLRFHSRPA